MNRFAKAYDGIMESSWQRYKKISKLNSSIEVKLKTQ